MQALLAPLLLALAPSGFARANVVSPSRATVLLAGWPVLPPCPLFGEKAPSPSSPSSPSSPRTPSPPPPAEALALSLERSAQQVLGIQGTIAAVAAEAAIETGLRLICDELGSLQVDVAAESSWQMLALPQKPGSVDSASISATGVSAAGLRAAACSLSFPRGLSVMLGNPLATPPTLPNLAEATEASFSVRLSQDDLTRSPILFASLEALLRELIRTGASSAIGRSLPADSSALQIQVGRHSRWHSRHHSHPGRPPLTPALTPAPLSRRADASLVSRVAPTPHSLHSWLMTQPAPSC